MIINLHAGTRPQTLKAQEYGPPASIPTQLMLGGSGGIKLRLEFPNKAEYYTNGDLIKGTLHVESGKSFSVQKIVIKLRCDEFAYVWVPNGQGGYYEMESRRHLSLSSAVFPERSVRHQSNDNATYTLGKGAHSFGFQFRIPLANKYPQSLRIKGSESGIRWYIKGSLYRGQVLAATKRVVEDFNMIPYTPQPYAMNQIAIFKTERLVSTYKEGYAELTRTTAGKFKQLFPGQTQHKLKTKVSLSMFVPDVGILQEPAVTHISMDLNCPEASLLLVQRVTLYLKQKIVVSVNDGWNTSVYRDNFPILTIDNMALPVKAAIAQIQDKFGNAKVLGRLPETFTSPNFDVSYKLVAEILVTSVEKPNSSEKLRISVPAYLHSYTCAANRSDIEPPHIDDESDALPFYTAEPQDGEETVGKV